MVNIHDQLNENSKNSNQSYENFIFRENKSYLKISFERIAFIFFVFFILAIIFSSKVIFLSIKKIPEIQKVEKKKNFRSTILDNNDNILAKSVPVINLGINPNLVINKENLLISLKLIFPNKKILSKKCMEKFFYVKKNKSWKTWTVLLLGDKSFIQEDGIARVYPNGNLFSHVIGQIDNENNGISGIEKTFDYELTTTKEPLKLTLDKDLQYLIKEELLKSQDIFQNVGSAAILMDINNGNFYQWFPFLTLILIKGKNKWRIIY